MNPAKYGNIWRHSSLTELGVKTVPPHVGNENCEAREDVELGCHATWHVSGRDTFNIISPSYGGALHYTYGRSYKLKWTTMSCTELFLLEMFRSVALSSFKTKEMRIHFRFVIRIALTSVKVGNPRASLRVMCMQHSASHKINSICQLVCEPSSFICFTIDTAPCHSRLFAFLPLITTVITLLSAHTK